MFKILQKTLTSFFITLMLVSATFLAPTQAHAQATAAWTGVCVSVETGPDGDTISVATIQGIQCIIANIFSIAVSGIGLAGFVMFIIGAFTYLLSGGNAKGVESARTTFTYAVVGLLVALSSIIILNVIAAFTGVNIILNFVIPNSDCGLSVTC